MDLIAKIVAFDAKRWAAIYSNQKETSKYNDTCLCAKENMSSLFKKHKINIWTYMLYVHVVAFTLPVFAYVKI